MRYSAVWTGTEALVWGQGVRDAYNPVTKRWRRLPGSHLLAVHDGFGLVAWTGRQLIGWGGGCCGDAFSDGVAYTPATSAWRQPPALASRRQPEPPGSLDRTRAGRSRRWARSRRQALARTSRAGGRVRPATNTWRRIPPLPEPRGGANVVWDGREILVVGGAGAARAGRPAEPAAVGFAYNPATNRWRRLPPMERAARVARLSGRAAGCSSGVGRRTRRARRRPPFRRTGSPTTRERTRGRRSPVPHCSVALDPTAVWTGKAMLVWGGHTTGCRHGARQCKTTVFADGAAFTPATP